MTVQTEDFGWFVENYHKLFQQYGLCYLAIRNRTVLGAYRSAKDALVQTEKDYPIGSFIVQLCNGNESGYTNYIANSQISVI